MNKISNLSKYWAIEPSALLNISSTVEEQLAGLSVIHDKPLNNTVTAQKRGNIAIISVQGVITPKLDIFTLFLGGTALESLAKDLQTALEDDEIKAILLDIDSPGGVAVGTSEMAELIYNARCQKTVWAYVGRNCCSAAYWLASAAEKIIAHKSALLGSIGVVSMIPVQEKPNSEGYKNIEIVSSNAKNKRPDPRTPEGLTEIRRELDSLEHEFISSIARFRILPEETILKDFGQGGVMIGTEAVNINMADSLGSFEDTIKSLSAVVSNNHVKGNNQMSDNNKSIAKDEISADFLIKECPEIIKALQAESFAAGKKAGSDEERERLLAIDAVSMTGYEDIVSAARKNPNMTAEKVALKIIEAEKTKGASFVSSLKKAEENIPNISFLPKKEQKCSSSQVSPQAPVEERANAEWNSNPELRTEFNGDKESFLAYFKANDSGLIKLNSK